MAHSHTANILLIGLRGSGKSTLARLLGAKFDRPTLDLDDHTPRFLNETVVAEAFRKHGEAAFRAAETRALTEALKTPAQIIALGGGTPTAPGAADLIRTEQRAGRALVVYLRADALTLRDRLAQADNTHRPSLTGKGVLEEIEEVLATRDPLYAALADVTIFVDQLNERAACADIVARVQGP